MVEQRPLIVGVQCLPQTGVHQHHVAADRQHSARIAPVLLQVGLQQRGFAFGPECADPVLDLAAGALGQHEQQRIGKVCPAGQVDDPEKLAGDRIADRGTRARQPTQRADVVLIALDERGRTGLQGGSDAVGAGELLGIAVAACQPHCVEGLQDRRIGGDALQHQAVRRGQNDADRLRRQVRGDPAQHRGRGTDQGGVGVGVSDIRQVDPVGMHSQIPRSAP